MPFEFRCVTCQKLLRIPDEAVTKKARCPDCGTIQEPGRSPPLASPFASDQAGRADPPPKAPDNPFASSAEGPVPPNPFADPARTAPAAGSDNPYLAPQSATGPLPLDREAVRRKLAVPATALLLTAGVTVILQLSSLTLMLIAAAQRGLVPDRLIESVGTTAFTVAVSVLILLGGVKMRRLESYRLALTAAILALLPCSGCCVLTFPFGIWALIVLLDPPVREAFR